MQDIALSFAFTGSTASNLRFNAAFLNFTLTHLPVRWSSYHVTYLHVREHPRRLQLRSQCTRTPKRKMHESRLRKWRRGAALCMCSGLITDCWSGGCRHFAPQQILQQPCAGAMTHTACLLPMLDTTSNTHRTPTSKHASAPGTSRARRKHSALFFLPLTFLWRYRNKLRSSSQVSASAWPVRLLLLLRDVASLPQSCSRGKSGQRSAACPERSVMSQRAVCWSYRLGTAREYLWESCESDGCRTASFRVENRRSSCFQGLSVTSDFSSFWLRRASMCPYCD